MAVVGAPSPQAVTTAEESSSDVGSTEQFEREFREVYRKPGVRHLAYACLFGFATVLAFYLVDLAAGNLSWMGGAQSLRLVLAIAYLAVAIACLRDARFVHEHYTLMVIGSCVVLSAFGCVASFLRNIDAPRLQLLWSVDMTLIVIIVVVHGFSRLGVATTVVAANICSVGVLGVLWQMPDVSAMELRRISIHLIIVGVGCAWLRYGIEQRERELFVLARENLRRNEHTRALETAIQAAREADATKAKFLAHMSHEIRTPMNGVLQILELIGNRAAAGDRELIAKGQKAGHALLSILNGVLDYAKLAHTGVKIRPTVTDLREIRQTAADLHEATATVKALQLRTDLLLPLDGNPFVLVDAVKLLEVINNLVANAIKFTERGHVSLSICLSRTPSSPLAAAVLSIAVSDSGAGMEPSELRQAFTPFFQSDSPARRSGGTGLGLAIVQQIVDEMQGSVAVESAVGQGAAFRVEIPVERVALVPDNHEKSTPALPLLARGPSEFRAKRILLVDDNDLNADLAAQILAMLGFDVEVAHSGTEALERLHVQAYDAVLMDCQMPGINGYETVQIWRATESTTERSRTPIIAVTAFTLAGDKKNCIDAGMDDYLGKPYTAKQLAATLRRWVKTG